MADGVSSATSAARIGSGTSRLTYALVRNSTVQIVGQTLASLISVVTFAAITRGLGPDTYGHYAAALAFLGVPIVLSDLGLSTALLRTISRRPEKAGEAVSVGFSARALLSAGVLGTAVLVAVLLPLPSETTSAVAVAAVGSFLLLLNTSLVPALQAELKMHWAVVANICGRTVTLGLTVAFLSVGGGLQAVLWAYVVGNGVTLIVDAIVVNRLVRLRPVLDFSWCVRLLKSAAVLGLVLAVDALFFYFDTLLLGALRSAKEVGLYASAYKFLGFVLVAGNAIHTSVFPVISRYLQAGDARLRPLLEGTTRGLFILAAPIVVVAVLIPGEIMSMLSGPEFEEAGAALRIFAPLFPILFVGYLYSYCLLADHREGLLLVLNALALALNAAVFCAVVPAYGLKAAAVVSVASATALTVAVGIAFRVHFGYLPRLVGLGGTALGALLMVPVLVLLPGPSLGVALLAAVVYMLVIVLLPGPTRRMALEVAGAGFHRLSRREAHT